MTVASGDKTRRARAYVIAADGAQSRIRRELGVKMLGRENVYDSVNIVLNADLTPWTAHRPSALYFIENERIRGDVPHHQCDRSLGLSDQCAVGLRLHASGFHP